MIAPSETPESLRERWKSGIWKKALDAILAEATRTTRTINSAFLESLNLPKFEGRLDLRGISFYEPIDSKIYGRDKCPFRLYGEGYKNIDFSYATVHFYVSATSITNCWFHEATLESCWFNDSTIFSCDFSHAFMPWFSASRETRFVRSIFDHTKIRHDARIYGYANFDECSFLNLDWSMIHFSRCLFNNCMFSGRLQKARSDCSASNGISAVRNFWSKLKHKGFNVFKDCSFDGLEIERFSVEDGSLTLIKSTGFPTYSLPSKEFRADRDYYSDNAIP
jgi:hypothetical protein